MNLSFNELWTRVVFALGFDKHVELHRGLPRMDLGFCEPMKLTKGGPWVWRAFGELTRDASILDFGETHQGWTLGLTSLVCVACVSCSCIHVTYGDVVSCSFICVTCGVACTRDMVACSCIRDNHGMTRTRDMVVCSCISVTCGMARTRDVVSYSFIHVTRGVARTRDVVCLENWPGSCPSWVFERLTMGGPWVWRALWRND